MKLHVPGLIEGEDFYSDEHNLVIFTEKYLAARGYCCGFGCRHCPYDYKAVPEPKRSQLILVRKSGNNKE